MAWVQYDCGPVNVLSYKTNFTSLTLLVGSQSWLTYGQVWPR